MRKIELVEKKEIEEVVKLTEQDLLDMISEDGLLSVIQRYEIPESFILKWGAIKDFDKNIIIQVMTLSEKFIKDAIDIDYFELEDVHGLNMKTYAGLSDKFTKLYENYINWERMILYLCSSEKIDDISKYEWVIEKFNLWKLISANQLPIDFIRKNRNKLDWRIVSIINNFTDEEKDEFVEDIPNYKEEWDKFKEDSNNFKIPGILQKDNLSIKDISKMIKDTIVEDQVTENKRFEVKHSIDKISNEDLLQIKEIIRSSNRF
jgi:hypothetical protein